MGRRYTVSAFLRKVAPLSDFNLTSDVIVGFPEEDAPAFENTLRVVERAGISKVHVFPYSPRPGTVTEANDLVPVRVKKERSVLLRAASDVACRKRWQAKVGAVDLVLVDRPGRGYGDDYSPWLVDAPAGELVRARAVGVSDEGVLGAAA
jgi:threonylcarbamoyladenosine tRNA methylthiotransferase MtaB